MYVSRICSKFAKFAKVSLINCASVESIGEELLQLDVDRIVINHIRKRHDTNKSRNYRSIIDGCVNEEYNEFYIKSSLERLLTDGRLGSRSYNGNTVYRLLDFDDQHSASDSNTHSIHDVQDEVSNNVIDDLIDLKKTFLTQ